MQNWIDWPDLQNHIVPLVQEALTVLGGPDVSALANDPGRLKQYQTNVLLALHTLVPPVRNDFEGLRFVGADPDADELRSNGSPNYIEVANDGSMELVLSTRARALMLAVLAQGRRRAPAAARA